MILEDHPEVIKARDFAIKAHGDQKYGSQPYSSHLEDVFQQSVIWSEYFTLSGRIDAAVVAWLHDVLEDTDVSFEQLAERFSYQIAFYVDTVTDPVGYPDRKSRKTAGYSKIRGYQLAVFVKLCDRIANTQAGGKIDMYRKEFPEFEKALRRDGEFVQMWEYLKQITFEKDQ